jgi:RimJ/RimL family protein N-acetyltransferase
MICLATSLDGLELRELGPVEACEYHALVDSNRQHLSKYGDYLDERDATRQSVVAYFRDPPDRNIRLGIWRAGALIGRVDLNPVDPPRYSLGYWLDSSHCGRGYATRACSAAIRYARDELGASDIFAGVAHANSPSVALLCRLGFQCVADFDRYSRFRLALTPESGPQH